MRSIHPHKWHSSTLLYYSVAQILAWHKVNPTQRGSSLKGGALAGSGGSLQNGDQLMTFTGHGWGFGPVSRISACQKTKRFCAQKNTALALPRPTAAHTAALAMRRITLLTALSTSHCLVQLLASGRVPCHASTINFHDTGFQDGPRPR